MSQGFRFTVEPIHFIFSFSFVLMTTFVPQLLFHKICLEENKNNTAICNNVSAEEHLQGRVQDEASFWQMSYLLCTNGLSFFTVLIWGPLTDVIGRRKGYLFSSFMLIMMNVIVFLNTYFMDISPSYILTAAIVAGSYGDSSGMISMGYAYMADITEESVQTKRMAILEGFFYFGFLLGGLSCGYLVQYLGYIFVPIVNGALSIILFLYVYFVLPTKQHIFQKVPTDMVEINAGGNGLKKFDWNLLNPFSHLKKVGLVFFHKEIRYVVITMYFVYFGVMLTANGDLYLSPFYLDYLPFKASASVIGYYISLTGLLASLGALAAFFLTYKFEIKDANLLISGLVLLSIGFILTGLSRNVYLVFASRIFQLALPLCTTISRSFTTKIACKYSDNGSILAGMECLDTLGATLASFLLGFLYRSTFKIYSGISFFVLSGLIFILLICFVIMWVIYRRKIRISECIFNEENE